MEGLQETLKPYIPQKEKYFGDGKIELDIFFDEFAPHKNAQKMNTMWIILARPVLKGLDRNKCPIFHVGVYGGEKKPDKPTFFKYFVNEFNDIYEHFEIEDVTLQLEIGAVICDSPGRSYLVGYKYPTGLTSCCKCKCLGKTIHRAGKKTSHFSEFPLEIGELRTDAEYRSFSDEEFHNHRNENTHPIFRLKTMIFPDKLAICGLHGIALGIVKRHFKIILERSKLSTAAKRELFSFLERNAFPFYPNDFTRRGRRYDLYKIFKGHEFYTFVNHILPMVHLFLSQKDSTEDNRFGKANDAALELFVGVRYCMDEKACRSKRLMDKAFNHFKKYLTEMKKIFKNDAYINFNCHQLLHIPYDCLTFGPLREFDGSPFGSEIHTMAGMLRAGHLEMQQFVNRTVERRNSGILKTPKRLPFYEIKNNVKNNTQYYKSLIISGRIIHGDLLDSAVSLPPVSIKINDSFVIVKNTNGNYELYPKLLCRVSQFFKTGSKYYGECTVYDEKTLSIPFFETPIESSRLRYYYIKNLHMISVSQKAICVEDFERKMFLMKWKSNCYVLSPLSLFRHPV